MHEDTGLKSLQLEGETHYKKESHKILKVDLICTILNDLNKIKYVK